MLSPDRIYQIVALIASYTMKKSRVLSEDVFKDDTAHNRFLSSKPMTDLLDEVSDFVSNATR